MVPVWSIYGSISVDISNDMSLSPVNPNHSIDMSTPQIPEVYSNEHLPEVLALNNMFISQIPEVSLDEHVHTIQVTHITNAY